MEARFAILLPDNPGKILEATALIRCLKQQVEGSFLYALVSTSTGWMIRNNPWIDEIFTWQARPDEQINLIRDLWPDYLIDLDDSRGYRRFKRKTRVLAFTIGHRPKERLIPYRERIFDTVRLFDVHDDGEGHGFQYPDFNPDWLPAGFLTGYAVLALEGWSACRTMPEDRLVDLVALIEKPLVATGNRAERPLAERLGQRVGCSVYPACGDFPEPETTALISAARAVITMDPGWAGLAAGMGKPLLWIGEAACLESIEGTVQGLDPVTGDFSAAACWIRKWMEPGS